MQVISKSIALLPHQIQFLSSRTRYLALVTGYAGGKTFIFVHKALQLAYLNQGFRGLCMEPTGVLLNDILIPEFQRTLDELQIPHQWKHPAGQTNLHLFLDKETILYFRSAENWSRVIGVSYAWAGIDEFDTISMATCEKLWPRVIGRIRVGPVNQFFVTTTPEGFKWTYKIWVEDCVLTPERKEDRELIQASTYDNPFVNEAFIQQMRNNYSPALLEAYLRGKFVNLTSGSVYPEFDRNLNHSHEEVDLKTIHVGCDFNVTKMSAVFCMVYPDHVHCFDEVFGVRDTEALCGVIKERYRDSRIIMYPDASGSQQKTSASRSDIEILRMHGFQVDCAPSNPPVKDRVACVNAMILNGSGERKLTVNTFRCPFLVFSLLQQVYNNGVPDKTKNHDHLADSLGYLIHRRFPIRSTNRPKTWKPV